MEPLEQDAMIRKYDYLVRACAARLGVHNDDDALQCGLIGLWEACRAWDGKRSFAPMAWRCITHNIIDCLRAQKQDARLPDGLPDDADEARRLDDAEFWASARSQCTLREYRTLDLILRHGLSKAAAARRMGCSRRTVQRLCRSAYHRLQARA